VPSSNASIKSAIVSSVEVRRLIFTGNSSPAYRQLMA
jgi:hypothetical protein